MKTFNIILTGVGGQGIITMLQVLDLAAIKAGFNVRSSELHGLSQRGGGVEAHVRFGKKVNSPMVVNGQVDLILALETLEGFRESVKAGKKTKILVNDYFLPFEGSPAKEEILSKLNNNKLVEIIPASKNCKDKLQNEVVCTMYTLGCAVAKKMMPISRDHFLSAIRETIPQKYLDLNIKAFELGYAS